MHQTTSDGASRSISSGFPGGGGWKNSPKEHHLKIKAICCAFLAVATSAVGISYYDAFGALGLVPASVLLISTILLFWSPTATARWRRNPMELIER